MDDIENSFLQGICDFNGTCRFPADFNFTQCNETENITNYAEAELMTTPMEMPKPGPNPRPTEKPDILSASDIIGALKLRKLMEKCCEDEGVPKDCMGMCRQKNDIPYESRRLEIFQPRCSGDVRLTVANCWLNSTMLVPELNNPLQLKPLPCNGKKCGDSCCGPECGEIWKEPGMCNMDGHCIFYKHIKKHGKPTCKETV